ncbi:hypothetical protein [Lysinibacillus telephonicus]|uniref:hypothetical protein n=1 Tax=Lysinibacillus telephonicus TaxID=1714840 RepID=UPI003BA33A37
MASLLILILIIFFIRDSQMQTLNEGAKLQFEVIERETATFEHITRNTSDEAVEIEFLTAKELNWSLMYLENNKNIDDYRREDLKDDEDKKQGRKVMLQPGEKLKHSITLPVEKLPKGKFELTINLATANIKTPSLKIEFENK